MVKNLKIIPASREELDKEVAERKLADERVQDQIQRVTILSEINQAITSTLDLRSVLDLLLEKIDHLLPYSVTTLRLINKESGLLEAVASRNIDEEEWKSTMREGGRGFSKGVLKNKGPVIIANVQKNHHAKYPEFLRKYGLISYLGVPLVAKGNIQGTLGFYTKEEHQFTKEEIDFLTTLGSQAAIAIHNSQLFEQVEKKTQELTALQAVTTAASQSLELQPVLHEVIKKITEIFHLDCTRVFLFNPQMDELHLKASFETHPEFWAQVRVFKRGNGAVGRVAETGEPMIFEDIKSDPQYQMVSQTKATQKAGFSFFALFPIKTKLKTVGTVVCIGQKPRRLTPDETQLIMSMAGQIAIAVEKATLFEETVTRARELSTLYAVATVVSQSLDVDFILRRVMRKVLEIFDFDAARIYLYDEVSKELRLLAHRGFPNNLILPNSYKPGQGILGRVFEGGVPILFEDIQTDPKFRQMAYEGILQRAGYRGSFGIPIRVKEKRVGVINFVSKSVQQFSSSEVQLIHSIANHVGIAVENAKLFEEVKRKSQELEALVKINRDIAALLDRDVLLPRIAEEARRILKTEGANFRLIEGDFLEHYNSLNGEDVGFRPRLRLSESLTGKIIKENCVVVIRHVAEDPSIIEEHRERLRKAGFNAYIGVPLQVGGRVIGAINLYTKEEREFSKEDINLISAFADQAAIAVENSQLFERSKSQALQLQRDVLELRQAREEIRKLNEGLEQRVHQRTAELEAANRELDSFSYSVSHDLRAPLRAINGFSRILLEEHASKLAPESQRYLRVVHDNAQQMGCLIDDLLTFSRLGRQPVKKQSVAPAELVHEVLKDLCSEQDGRRIEIAIGDLPVCQGDPALLKLVFVNLLSNAFKFTRRREVAAIEIGCREEGGERIYYVRDNGVAFDEQYADKLFGIFQRLHRAEDYEGTGVGLATVQRVIQGHGGRVWAEAEVDKGATFYFTLEGGTRHDK